MASLVSGVLQLTTSAVGKVIETAATAATVPVRVFGLIGQTELLINRASLAVTQAEELIQRVAATAAEAGQAVAEVRTITAAAALTVEQAAAVSTAAGAIVSEASTAMGEVTTIATRAGTVAGEVESLLGDYSPTLRQAAPLAARFVTELTPAEVTAAIRMIDELPALQRHLVEDVMPLLSKLDQVGPDLHKLLSVTEDLHLAIAGLPGLKMLRKRGEERAQDQE